MPIPEDVWRAAAQAGYAAALSLRPMTMVPLPPSSLPPPNEITLSNFTFVYQTHAGKFVYCVGQSETYTPDLTGALNAAYAFACWIDNCSDKNEHFRADAAVLEACGMDHVDVTALLAASGLSQQRRFTASFNHQTKAVEIATDRWFQAVVGNAAVELFAGLNVAPDAVIAALVAMARGQAPGHGPQPGVEEVERLGRELERLLAR